MSPTTAEVRYSISSLKLVERNDNNSNDAEDRTTNLSSALLKIKA